jgi:Rieske Fe-S protein
VTNQSEERPVHEAVSNGDTSRKRFIGWLLGTSAGAFLAAVFYPVVRYLIPPLAAESAASTVTLSIRPEDIAANTAEIFKFGSRAGILLRTPSGELRAFSAVCTHLSCIVQYRPDLGHIWCACHNGHFDLNGRNISGPPPAPLEAFTVNVREDQIVVSKGG